MDKNYLLGPNGKKSSMRFAFLVTALSSSITACIGGVILAVLDIIINQGRNLPGVAMIIAALASVSWTAFFGKSQQHRTENNAEKN